MKLSSAELGQLLRIIDAVYEGEQPPRRLGGDLSRFGQFLRRLGSGRLEVQHLLAREGLATTKKGWVNGAEVGPIALAPLAPLKGAVPHELWGPVERVPALAEELGAVVDLTLWTSAVGANRAHVLLSGSLNPISLAGAYRWFAPSRVTPGEAVVATAEADISWRTCRFLKTSADDLSRAPHPLEYVIDYRLGDPGLKAFRVLSIRKQANDFVVLPGFDAPSRPIRVASPISPRLSGLADGALALVLAYVEPWSREWVVVDFHPADEAESLTHLLTWADFRAELSGQSSLGPADLRALRLALISEGLDPPAAHEVLPRIPERGLNGAARALVHWLRYGR